MGLSELETGLSIFQSLFPDGTASLPSIGFAEDTNTGLYRIGADNIGISLGGTLRLNYGAEAFAFQENTTISSTGTLTINALTLGGAVAGGDQAWTNVGDMTFAAGSILASGSTNGNTLLLRANDTTFLTLTTGATDACTLDAITMSGTWLASGTVTLPAFTAGGDIDINSKLMTNTFEMFRALRREMAMMRWHRSDATQVVSGSGATEISEDEIFVHTGATHASTAGRYYNTYLITTANPNGLNWDKKFFLAFSVIWRGTLATNLTIRVQLTQASTIGNLAAHGLGMQTNGANINLATYGAGGSQQLVSAATNLVDDQRVHILIEHDPASADRLYINGVLAATQSTAANIPSTDPNATYYLFASVSRSGGADTDDEGVRYGGFEFAQEF